MKKKNLTIYLVLIICIAGGCILNYFYPGWSFIAGNIFGSSLLLLLLAIAGQRQANMAARRVDNMNRERKVND